MCEDQSLPGFRKPTTPTDPAELQTAAVDLERIRDGGIPLGAERRLRALAGTSTPLFSSDLSVKEYALAQASGLLPIAQVMGSSVVQHGWQNYGWQSYGGGVREMPGFATPWNLARERSFGRLRLEAQLAGADAVIAIRMSTADLDQPGVLEYLVFGTAVRETTLAGGQAWRPRMCTLSAQDVDKLRRIGAETLRVIGHTAVVAVALGPQANQMMRSWSQNQELGELTQGVYAARHLAMSEITRQARQAGANDMVISSLAHHIHHQEYESLGFTQHLFLVVMHVLGTAIRLGAHRPHPGELATPRLSINLGTHSTRSRPRQEKI